MPESPSETNRRVGAPDQRMRDLVPGAPRSTRAGVGPSASAESWDGVSRGRAQPNPTAFPDAALPPVVTGDAFMDQLIAGVMESLGDGQSQLDPIGGYWNGPANLPEDVSRNQPPGSQLLDPYVDGDEIRLLRGLPAEVLARLQDTLVAVGFIGEILPGEVDDATIAGFTRLLAMANRNGERWAHTVGRLQRKLDSGELVDRTPIDPGNVSMEYLPPDPAEIRNSIRSTAAQIVPDIELSDEEIESLRVEFENLGRQQYDAAQGLAQARADARAVAAETGEDQVVTGPPQVNAAVRFQELLEERFADNIRRREMTEEEIERRQMTGGVLSGLLTIATGRGM